MVACSKISTKQNKTNLKIRTIKEETISKKLYGTTEQVNNIYNSTSKYPAPSKVKFTMPAIQSKLSATERKRKV